MTRRPTISDVARHAGVSNMTVSRVVNESERVSPDTRDRVRKAMQELGYLSNEIARGMRNSRSNTVGFLLPDMTNPLNAAVGQTVEIGLSEAGFRTLIATSRFDLARECLYLRQFESHRVDGIIAMLSDEDSAETVEFIRKCAVPVVIIDRAPPVPVDRVLCEHRGAMRKAVQYLASLGHSDIALINGPMTIRPTRERTAAYVEAMRELGVGDPTPLMRHPRPTVEDGYAATIDILSGQNRPTAMIVGSNQNLFGALRAIRDLGLRIPEDLSFIGADEDLAAEFVAPPLTMIRRNMSELGDGAVKLLTERMAQGSGQAKKTLMIASEIVLRDSCAAPPTGRE